MKKLLLSLITLLFLTNAFGQKFEFNASLNSGLFSFVGSTAFRNTFLVTYTGPHGNTQIGPCIGSRSGLSYGWSFNLKRVAKKKYFFGLDIGYEVLRSRASINREYEYTLDSTTMILNGTNYKYNLVTRNITGNVFTNNYFVNVSPFIGYRCKYKKINFDLSVAMDMAYYLNIKVGGSAKKSDGTYYNITYYPMQKHMDVDFRPRFQLSSGYKKIGVYIGYAYGISNYAKNAGGQYPPVLTSKIFRFGITYKLMLPKRIQRG
jgi:hypothetical protein